MAKWGFCAETKMPRRVGNDEAARIVQLGGRYLGKTEAARMLSALEAKDASSSQQALVARSLNKG